MDGFEVCPLVQETFSSWSSKLSCAIKDRHNHSISEMPGQSTFPHIHCKKAMLLVLVVIVILFSKVEQILRSKLTEKSADASSKVNWEAVWQVLLRLDHPLLNFFVYWLNHKPRRFITDFSCAVVKDIFEAMFPRCLLLCLFLTSMSLLTKKIGRY